MQAPGPDANLLPACDFLDERLRVSALARCADAARHLPERECQDAVRKMRETGSTYSDEHLRVLLAHSRLCNPICSGCGKKDRDSMAKMRPCAGCKLVFYCDTACAQRDWDGAGKTTSRDGHRAQCAAGDGGQTVMYSGPHEIVLLKV